MKTDTLFQICMYFTVCLLIFTLSVNFVATAGFYSSDEGTSLATNLDASTDGENIIENVTEKQLKTENGDVTPESVVFSDVWNMAVVGGSISAIILAWLFKDARIIGVYIFGVVFWTSYVNMFDIINVYGNFIPDAIGNIAHAGSIFVFMGSIVGMFTGSG